MSAELKPCPFCGEEAHRMQPVTGGWLVGCYDDNCAGSTCRAFNEDWNRRAPSPDLDALREENERLREALTPSGATKLAYIGEFEFTPIEESRTVKVPWTTVKEIMAAVLKRAERPRQ
jgi:hypothetical protein